MDPRWATNIGYYYYSTPEGCATLPTVDCCPVCADLRLDYASVLGHYNPDVYVQTDFADACSIIAPLPRLLQTATAGCASCSLLHKAISELSNDRIDFSAPTLNAIFHFHPDDILKGYVCRIRRNDPTELTAYSPLYEEGDPTLPFEFEIYTPMYHRSPWRCIGKWNHTYSPREEARPYRGGPTNHIPVDSSSHKCFEVVKTWLQWCCLLHLDCPSTLAGELPKRVLDVGTSAEPKLLIHEGGSQEEEGYIALSHRWGDILPLRSTRATLPRWKENIPWDALPKTFQDADDEEDWETESAKMGSIYQDAFLVIAATLSRDGDGSVFARQPPNHRQFHCNDSAGFNAHFNADEYLTSAATYPVLSRAWCFQERLLGARVLHYTATELVWECGSRVSCECNLFWDFSNDGMILARWLLGQRQDDQEPSAPASTPNPRTPSTSKRFRIWKDLVAQCSQKALTYPRDTFPALSGVARHFTSAATGRYLAGLWEKDLISSLLWKSIAREGPERPESYICPSWSWAAPQRHNGFVGKLYTDPIDVVRVLDVQCTAKDSSNPFGRLIGGTVKLPGPVVRTVLTAGGGEPSSGSSVIECGGCASPVCLDRMEEVDKHFGKQVHCLKMRTDSYAMNKDSKHYDTGREDDRHRWIVLVREQDGPEETCERIGIVEHMGGEGAAGERDVCIV